MCFAWSVILFYFVLLAVRIISQDLKFLNERESSYSYIIILLLIDLHLYLFGVVLSFTSVFHLYPMSKWLNELNIINLKLYMFHILIPWGVMTSRIISIGGKFIES